MFYKMKILLTLCLLMVGCGTTRVADSDRTEISNGDKVLITTHNVPLWLETLFFFVDDFANVSIRSVDGVKVKDDFLNADNQAAVLPGKRKIKLHCHGTWEDESVHYTEVVELNARRGYQYQISGRVNSDKSCYFEINQKLDREHIAKTALLDDPSKIVGVWEGRWDDKWVVVFEIAQVNSDKYSVVYNWQDYTDGPMKREEFTFYSVSEDTIENHFITINLIEDGEYGAFAQVNQKLTTKLKRIEPNNNKE